MRWPCLSVVWIVLTASLGANQAAAFPRHPEDYVFIDQMPTVEQVRKDVHGDNALDTDGRQHAAFVLLGNLVDVSADGKGVLPWPKRERELKSRYSSPLGVILGNDDTFDEHDMKVFYLSLRYRADPAFTRPTLEKYFTAAAMRELEPILDSMEAGAKQSYLRAQVPAGMTAPERPSESAAALKAALPALLRPLVDVPVIAWIGCVIAFIVWLIMRALPFGLERNDPLKLRVGRQRYSLCYMTGEILKIDRTTSVSTSTTYHSVQGADGGWTSIPSTHVSAHREFRAFIQRPDGSEDDITLSHTDLPVREGHRLAAVWALKGRAKSGHYVFFHIYDMKRTQTMPVALEQVIRPRCHAGLPIILAALWLGLGLRPLLPETPWLPPVALAVACLIAYGIVLSLILRSRRRAFANTIIDQILGAIPEPRPSGAIYGPGGMRISTS